MKFKNSYLKYIAILLVVVLFITASFLALELWEKNKSKFAGSSADNSVIVVDGQEYVLKKNIETFLVLGLDKYEGESSSDSYNNDKQADFLMLFVFDNESKQCSAIQINRDTMANVRVLGVDETKVLSTVTKQIALAHTYGKGKEASCRNTKDSVEDLLNGVTVDHYVSFVMDSVIAMNDFVGGVEVTVLDDFTGIDPELVKGEKINLTGEQAIKYVRERYGLEDSTNSTRMVRQQQYVNALYDKTMSCIEADDEFIVKLVDLMDDYVVYDSSNHKMQKFAEKFKEYEFLGISQFEGESKMGEKFIEFYPDEESLQQIVVDFFYTPKDDE